MKIAPLLRPEYILLDLQSPNRTGALHELTQLVKAHPLVTDFMTFCGAIDERETMGNTALGGYEIAFPHARTDQVTGLVIAVGRRRDGVLFEGTEPQMVKLIFLLGTPKNMVLEYLQLLGALARLLKDKSFVQSLLAAESAGQFVELFRQQENRS